MRTVVLLLTCLGFAALLPGQPDETPHLAQAMPMPGDRAEDSYAIYSQLLKGGPYKWGNGYTKQWLVEGTTNAIPLGAACNPAPEDPPMEMSPREAVKAPEDRQGEWNEVLADFDRHCHDVIQLEQKGFKTELPVHLLNAEDMRRYRHEAAKPTAEFADAAGLHRFTEVFFNTNHTLALVEADMRCGSLCGHTSWVVLERREGRWEMVQWVREVISF